MGAYGLMQLMPATKQMYQALLRTDTLNLDKNEEDIYIGLNYLKDLYSFWKGKGNLDKVSWRLALASYNAGKGNVLKYKGIPPYQQTIDFVSFIYRAHSNPDFYASYIKKYENQSKSRT
jgi:soluble lytic murein transglycosylase-like protein